MSEEVKVVSIPLEDPFDVPENIIIDLKSAKFADDFIENISIAFVYLRNIEFAGEIDFSKFTTDEKIEILKLYMTRDLKDFNIKQLDYTIFQLYTEFENSEVKSILDSNEINQFKKKYESIYLELLQLIISLPLYVLSLDKNILQYDFSEIKHVSEMPKTYECMCMLLKYDETNMLMMLPSVVDEAALPEKVFFDKVFKYDNSQLANVVQSSIFSILYDGMINVVANDKHVLQKEQ